MTNEERQAILDAAIQKPASAQADGVSVQSRGLAELQGVVDGEKATAGAKTKNRGIRFSKLVPPGANG